MRHTLDKRACRQFADPKLKFNCNNGLLHVDSYKYIIRTATRNIAGQRILLLFVYLREQLLSGDFQPRWTVFQSKTDYSTLSFREDGTTTWQTSLLENLEREWGFAKRCAFYAKTDEDRVTQFCSFNDRTGLDALSDLQWKLKSGRELEKRRIKQRKIIARMENLPALPRDLKNWCHREVLPQYLFYHYLKGKSPLRGYCTACRCEVEVTDAKHGKAGLCPHCKKTVQFKAWGRIGNIEDRATIQVLQRLSGGELVIRVLKLYCTYRKKEIPKISIHEATRIFVYLNGEKVLSAEPYHSSYDLGDLTPWKKGYSPIRYMYQENFYASICGHLYSKNLEETLLGTSWQYSQLKQFYLYDRVPMEVTTFLQAYLQQPKLEMLIKLGFVQLASDLIYRGSYAAALDDAKKKPHEILRVDAEDIPFLKDCRITLSTLTMYQYYAKMRLQDRKRLLLWQLEKDIGSDQLLKTALQYTTVHKLIRYMDEQYALLKERLVHGVHRYSGLEYVLREYDDYLKMCLKENYDLKNNFILFPRDLQAAHDRVSARIKLKANIKRRKEFMRAYQAIHSRLDFEKFGLMIVYPEKPEDIVREGNELHHCVGGYVDRVADKQCIILFLRHADDPQTPFVTVEVCNGKVAQVRGKNNGEPPKEVMRFVTLWEKKVLNAQALPVAA
ncbi:MAG: PcfJ domain-containing protein [Oscillospiraceae bacterium]|nr:PcfJ domain-containing protein [Oscillospiraceae bacterium]